MKELEGINEGQLNHEEIEKRAFEIYLQQHNGEEGHALEDWLVAEAEMTQKRRIGDSAPLRAKAVGQERTR